MMNVTKASTTHVLTIFPCLRIFMAIPKEVGPKAAPAAIAAFVSTPSANAIDMAIAMGRMEPIIAMIIPLAPISFNVVKSMSIPASRTRRIRLN